MAIPRTAIAHIVGTEDPLALSNEELGSRVLEFEFSQLKDALASPTVPIQLGARIRSALESGTFIEGISASGDHLGPDDALYTFAELEAAVRHFALHMLSIPPERHELARRGLRNHANLRESLRTYLRGRDKEGPAE